MTWPRHHSPKTDPDAPYWLRRPEPQDVQDIVAWLAEPAMNQWFDFGLGKQALSAPAVQLMLESARHRLRVFGQRGQHCASGVAAVSELHHAFGIGSFWVLRDSHRPACQDMTFLASRNVLSQAFHLDRLHSISAWAVETNVRSQRLLKRLGFREIGTQRACHIIGHARCGRLLYDLLPEELSPEPVSAQHTA